MSNGRVCLIQETFLYHLEREDIQHNFSPIFYPLRLLSETPSYENDLMKTALCFTATATQLLLVIRTSFRYAASHLPFALFTQTCYFVIFNKVATSQYFTWYLCLIPLVLHRLPFRFLGWAFIFFAWLGAQLQWLLQAYFFEFEKRDNLFYVFFASIIYVISHTALVWILVRRYDATLTKEMNVSSKIKRK